MASPVSAFKRHAKRALPASVIYQLSGRRRPFAPQPIDLRRLELLRRSEDSLRDEGWLPSLVRDLGLNGHHPHIMPAAAHRWLGQGLRISQSPHQFARYLRFIADRDISTYLEIGTENGGTFATTVTYLERTGHHLERAMAVDPQYAPGPAAFARQHPRVSVVRGFSTSPALRPVLTRTPWDLVLIDGDHSYEGVTGDFALMREAGARIVAFHDIVDDGCPGVRRFWSELRAQRTDEYEFVEFVEQYDDVTAWTGRTHYGIGVAVRRPAA